MRKVSELVRHGTWEIFNVKLKLRGKKNILIACPHYMYHDRALFFALETHKHTFARTHIHTRTHTHAYTHTYTLSLTLSLSLIHTHKSVISDDKVKTPPVKLITFQ